MPDAATVPIGDYPPAGKKLKACRACGFAVGSNAGRCLVCFDAFGDGKLCEAMDWAAKEFFNPRFEQYGQFLYDRHGSMLATP